MKVLVLNCGSSSIKYQVLAMPGGERLARGLVQRIGEAEGSVVHDGETRFSGPVPDHSRALELVIEALLDGVVADLGEIGAVGHRVVHGGERFASTVRIDDAVVEAIRAHVDLAPLHNPPNLLGIEVARRLLPGAVQVAVFDTAFHQTMPERAWRYALPDDLYRKHKIRRYGFHGTSHRYVTLRAAALLGREPEQVNLVTCHLGNGSSVAAIEGGRSVDTSMGMTPLEGLVMGTRCGDLDPALPLHLQRVAGLSPDEVDHLLNKRSGLLGLSGLSNDMRELERAAAEGHAGARRALDAFVYRLKKYVGAYVAALGHLDALVFTGGIGENSVAVREGVCTGLEMMGISLDPEANRRAEPGAEVDVSDPSSWVRVFVIPTDEEKMIALDTYAVATGG